MKRFMTLILLMAIAFTGANAQLLYKISGKDLKQPSYIVGTYHLAPVSFVDSIPGLRRAMDETAQVCGELDMSNMQSPENVQKMMQAMMLPDGKTLKDVLTADEMETLNKFLRENMGVDLTNPMVEQQMGKMSPQAISVQLQLLLYLKQTPGFDPTNLFDGYFQKEAAAKQKPIIGFETIDFQIKTLYQGQTIERQKELLMCGVNNPQRMMQAIIDVTDAFFSQDLAKMQEVMEREYNDSCDSTPEEENKLIKDRNVDWLTKMPAILSAHPTLFAVGAGHLPSEFGVLNLLKEAGYTVEAVGEY